MADDTPEEQVAVIREQLDDKRKAAEEQLTASKERLQDTTIAEASQKGSNPLELRDLLNKLRLAWRGDRLIPQEIAEKENT